MLLLTVYQEDRIFDVIDANNLDDIKLDNKRLMTVGEMKQENSSSHDHYDVTKRRKLMREGEEVSTSPRLYEDLSQEGEMNCPIR